MTEPHLKNVKLTAYLQMTYVQPLEKTFCTFLIILYLIFINQIGAITL